MHTDYRRATVRARRNAPRRCMLALAHGSGARGRSTCCVEICTHTVQQCMCRFSRHAYEHKIGEGKISMPCIICMCLFLKGGGGGGEGVGEKRLVFVSKKKDRYLRMTPYTRAWVRKKRRKRRKRSDQTAVNRIRTCAGRAQLISSQSP